MKTSVIITLIIDVFIWLSIGATVFSSDSTVLMYADNYLSTVIVGYMLLMSVNTFGTRLLINNHEDEKLCEIESRRSKAAEKYGTISTLVEAICLGVIGFSGLAIMHFATLLMTMSLHGFLDDWRKENS